jgi:hypothetical protein
MAYGVASFSPLVVCCVVTPSAGVVMTPFHNIILLSKKGKRSQDTESFRDQADLRRTYTLRHPARSLRSAPLTCENLRRPATAYKTGIIQVMQLRPVISYEKGFPAIPGLPEIKIFQSVL